MSKRAGSPAVWAVITAAGSGTRLGADQPKALVEASGRTLLGLALERTLCVAGLSGVVITCPVGSEDLFASVMAEELPLMDLPRSPSDAELHFVAGGASRQASVKAGLDKVVSEGGRPVDTVLIHDAARALAPTDLMDRLVVTVVGGVPAVIPGLPVADTIKQVSVDESGVETVVATPDRRFLRAAQTPQAFQLGPLWQAHVTSENLGSTEETAVTDDASLFENVVVIPGSPLAFKVTTRADLANLGNVLSRVGDLS